MRDRGSAPMKGVGSVRCVSQSQTVFGQLNTDFRRGRANREGSDEWCKAVFATKIDNLNSS